MNTNTSLALAVLQFVPVDGTRAKAIIEINHPVNARSEPTFKREVGLAISSTFKNKVTPVPGSFISLDNSKHNTTIMGILMANREVQDAAFIQERNMKSVSASGNIYIDEDDELWQLQATAGGQVVVRTSGIADSEALLRLLSTSSRILGTIEHNDAKTALTRALEAKGEDFVTYVDSTNQTQYGYVIASVKASPDSEPSALMLSRTSEEPTIVNLNSIVEIHSDATPPSVDVYSKTELAEIALASANQAVTVEHLLDYYRRLYSKFPEFYANLEARIKSHTFL
jgi:hypothetical protein